METSINILVRLTSSSMGGSLKHNKSGEDKRLAYLKIKRNRAMKNIIQEILRISFK
jgi:hypothetical protein